MSGDGWRAYLERFHADAPGVTERLLRRARGPDGRDPYAWTADVIPTTGALVDLACGSAPLARHIAPGRYVGVDRSSAELRVAARRVGGRVVRADVADLPLADDSVDVVTCLMGFMVTQPLDAVQREVRRVLRPGPPGGSHGGGGYVIALLPTGLPGGVIDALRWTALAAALGIMRLQWPNPQTLRAARAWIDDAFTVGRDEQRTFWAPIDDEASARRLISSLYLPGVPDDRIERAVQVAGRWLGGSIGLRLRRVVARL